MKPKETPNYLAQIAEKIKAEHSLYSNEQLVSIRSAEQQKDEGVVDVITFCNRPDLMNLPGSNLKLFLSQRVILKVFYMGTRGNEHITLSPEEEGWITVKSQDAAWAKLKSKLDGVATGKPHNFNFTELNLACGRRSSKTLLASVICAYEAYKLVKLGDPYVFYNIPYDEEMAIICVANSQKQAGRLFAQIKARIRNAPFFKGKIQGKGESQSEIRIYTDMDLQKIKEGNVNIAVDGSIVIICGHSNPDTLRGYSSPCIIFDELQYYTEHPVVSGTDFYNSLIPSITKFTVKGDGRLIEISTTGTPSGIFYNIYKQGQSLDKDFKNVLGFHLATWDINEEMGYNCDFLTLQRKKDPEAFDIEYGARWATTGYVSRYFDEEKVRRAISNTLCIQEHPTPGTMYFMHIDPAATRNNYALVIVGKKNYVTARGEKRHKIFLAFHKVWKPVPGYGLDLVKLDEETLEISRRFKPASITYDSWNSVHSIDTLKRQGFNARQIAFSRGPKATYYQNLVDLLDREELELYCDDLLIGELLNLKYRSNGGRKLTITPDYRADVDTDDLSDCLAGACWMAAGVKVRDRYPTSQTMRMVRMF